MRIDVQKGDKIIFKFQCSFASREINASGIVKKVLDHSATVETSTGPVEITEPLIVAKLDPINGKQVTILPFRGLYTVFQEVRNGEKSQTDQARVGA